MAQEFTKECFREELDMFSTRPYQTEIIKVETVELKPLSTIQNASALEFLSFGLFDSYRDCYNSYLKLELTLVDKDGKPSSTAMPARAAAGAGATVTVTEAESYIDLCKKSEVTTSCVNNLFGSLFSQCNVFLNTKPVSIQETNLPLRNYIESRFNYSRNEVQSKLAGNLYYPDTPGQLDVMNKQNAGFAVRGQIMATKGKFTIIGRLSNDIFSQGKFLLSNIDMRVLLPLEKADFYMLGEDTDQKSLQITDASLFIPHVTVSPDILLSHEKILQRMNAMYNTRRVDVRTFTVNPQSNQFVLDNIVIGELPSLVVFGFVDTDALTGKRSKNPYNFQHYNIQTFTLSVNGFQFLPKPLEFNYTKKTDDDKSPVNPNEGAFGYFRLKDELQFHNTDRAPNITQEEFSNGSFLLPFDLTADRSNDKLCTNAPTTGSLKIECRFLDAITKSISVVMYCETDSEMQIDLARNIYVKG